MSLRSFVGLVGLLPGLLYAQSVSQIATSPGVVPTQIDREKVRLEQRLGAQVPLDAQFRDENGATKTFAQLVDNKPTIILPIFYLCRGVCGLELQGAIAALRNLKTRQLGRDFNIAVVSIHPKETPDLARAKYVQTITEVNDPASEKGWRFVVGDWKNIHKVTDAIGFKYTYDADKDAINHPSGIVFVSPKGVVSSYIYGADYSAKQFERNIDFAGRGQIGAKVEEIFFGCVHIDPLTGQRSIVIENVLKVLGVITVGSIALMLLVLTGRARLRRKRSAESA